eukprot:gnl/MRDRNA2_/MRDRNA2_118580_c0_seq1.p1 gnl/MRDRNA2_/MRDRNA2_118580_c0~~gnl/MRDRNA2_/MRDRNA2_118580_c0_seq1.p1  ORF type:complete len:259 (+),score=44.71 gnl/MRDRNA2_/MRDRNA2_118580_c0_seq1:54-830(+)
MIMLHFFELMCMFAAPISAFVVHDNMLFFQGAGEIRWRQKLSVVTSGQPFRESTASGAAIDVVAGRKASREPAYDFNDDLNPENVIATKTAWPYWTQQPRKLNFALKGDIQFTISGERRTCYGMKIGQGSFVGFHNNWWIGANHCFREQIRGWFGSKRYLRCECGIRFLATGEADEFKVSLVEEEQGASAVNLDEVRSVEHPANVLANEFEAPGDESEHRLLGLVVLGLAATSVALLRLQCHCNTRPGYPYLSEELVA